MVMFLFDVRPSLSFPLSLLSSNITTRWRMRTFHCPLYLVTVSRTLSNIHDWIIILSLFSQRLVLKVQTRG